MPADLDITNGTASFVSARLPAWHRLGTVFPTKLTAEEALTEAHLGGWNVRKIPLQTVEMHDDGFDVDGWPEFFASGRTNPITGKTERWAPVGKNFTHVQNEQHVEFLQALLDESGAFIETAGALRGGRQVFFTAKLPESMLIGGVDRVDNYVAVLNGHDGNLALTGIATPIRIVCSNTAHAALRGAHQRWSRRHTSGVHAAVAEAKQTLQLTYKFSEAFEAEAERMIQQAMTDAAFEKIIDEVYGNPTESDSKLQATRKIERLDVVRGLYHDADTQANIRGTNWAAYQAIGEYEDWFAKVRGEDTEKDLARALRAIDGKGVGVKERAFAALRVPAKAGA